MLDSPHKSGDRLLFIYAVIAAQLIGGLITQLSPLVVGGVITGLTLSAQQAGYIAFAEFLVLSITAILVAPVLHRFPYRTICFYAVCLAITANVVSVQVTTLTVMIIVRCLAGIGEGIIYAISLAAVASHSRNPDKVYGYFQLAWALVSVILFSAGGYLTDMYAHRGIFGLTAIVMIIFVFFLRGLPSDKPTIVKNKPVAENEIPTMLGIYTLAGIFIFIAGGAAVYTFFEQLGVRSGLTTTQVGFVLTVGSGVGIIGAGLATWLNVRKGRFIPISAFCIWYASTSMVLCLNSNATVYIVAVMSSFISFYFAVPYLFGLAAALDKKGRLAAAAGSVYLLGFAFGPMIAGNLIEWHGYAGLGLASASTTMLSWSILIYIVYQLGTQKSVAV